ncbi:MAG: M23 family metallopeptidase [Alicyclobacillus sp.]|nr:M23 family metallopeptidase [Alicyclobacillus sp.]
MGGSLVTRRRRWTFGLLSMSAAVSTLLLVQQVPASAVASVQSAKPDPQAALVPLYQHAAAERDLPWTLLAGIDRYAELTKSKADRAEHPWYGLAFQPAAWAGMDNPNWDDVNPTTIALFHGLGVDANGDGLAVQWDPADRIAVLANWLDEQSGEDDDSTAVWDLFQDATAMDRVYSFAAIFERYGIPPDKHCFPLAKRYNYTIKHSFGAGRSYGGPRIHEGVDIFAGYGTPVLACSYGYVELLGWNRFGGWRVGIRDVNNVYYYYAHLSSFAKGLHQGQLVEPGQVIGYVGSSGYGPPGTSGKFPPHLHFGMYKDTGRSEWAFSPSAQLLQWQRLPQHIVYPDKAH